MKFDICKGDVGDVNISMSECGFMNAFITIYTDDDSTPSPFKEIDDAELFAEIIVKLLKVINDDLE